MVIAAADWLIVIIIFRNIICLRRRRGGRLLEHQGIAVPQCGMGGVIALQVSATPMQPGKKDGGVVLVLMDLTDAQRVEDKLRQLDRLAKAGTVAASMAHEIKNALVAGRTFVDLLLEKNPQAELAA